MQYRPWNSGRFTIGVGLRPLGTQSVFLQDEEASLYRENKRQVRTENLARYYPIPVGLSAAEMQAVVDYLQSLTSARAELLPGEPAFRDSFDEFCCGVQEDVAIWKREGEREWMAAIHLCAPNHWAPEEKVGRNFTDTHLPIPKIAPISQMAGKLFTQIQERGAMERFAWGVATDRVLNHHPQAVFKGRSFNVTAPELFARVERQTVFAVPGYDLLVFTIRTFFVNVATLSQEDKRLISQSMDSMDEEILRYKGLLKDRPAIQAWLARFMETERMSLRPFTRDDARLFKELDSDPAVMTHLTDGAPSTDEQVAAATERVLAQQAKYQGKFGIWIAHEKSTGEFLGWFLFRPDKKDPENTDVIELGYRLKQKFWGKGFASEGGRHFLQLGFEQYQLKEIFAITMLANQGSWGVMKKLGMQHIADYTETDFPGADKRAVRYSIKP